MDTETKSPLPSPLPAPPEAPEPPPPGVRAMATVRWVLVGLSVLAATWTWAGYVQGERPPSSGTSAAAAKAKYRCPMHAQIVSDEPGECPICHMTLVPVAVAPPPRPPAPASSDAGSPGSVPPGTTPIHLSFDRVQAIGVRTAVAEEREAGATLRVTATVAAPEQGASEVHVRTPGFVERIGVRETGVKVGAGQELLGIYSPEVYQAESELLAAKGFGEAGARSVEASRQRLELLGMTPRAIDEVLASGKPMRVIPIVAPAGGYVAKKNVVLGSYVTPESALYELVDLSRVYVVADVFQRDIGSLRAGTEGRFTPSEQPEATLSARVDLVYPQLDAAARTTRVRMQVKNDRLALRPGQYGTVDFVLAGRKVVVVPRDAVVDTGRLVYVFVDEGGGQYTPRAVTLGREREDGFEVREGIVAGDRVVAGATFLIDSESRLEASLAAPGEAPPHGH